MSIIRTHALHRTYTSKTGVVRHQVKDILALQDVNLEIGQGELFGLLGPNGAGKTTLTKILCTILLPSQGRAEVFGLDVVTQAQAIRPRIGIIFGGERGLYWRLSARATLAGMGWLLGSITLPARTGLLVSNMVAYLMFVVCGVNFPIQAMPGFLQLLGRMLPLTHGLMAIRGVIDGASYLQVAPLVALEILIGLLYAMAAWLVFRKRLMDTRRTGQLELV